MIGSKWRSTLRSNSWTNPWCLTAIPSRTNSWRRSVSLRKLRYHQDLIGRTSNQGSLFASHPGLDDRIEMAEHTALKLVDKPLVFDGYSKQNELVATISFASQAPLPSRPDR